MLMKNKILYLILSIFFFTSNVSAENASSESNVIDEVIKLEGFDISEYVEEENAESVFNALKKSEIATEDLDKKSSIAYGYFDSAEVVVLNKVTANSEKLTLKVGDPKYFANAEVRLEKCWKPSESAFAYNLMLISVVENRVEEDPNILFRGWLISSSPSLSTMEHPVYEILAIKCSGKKL